MAVEKEVGDISECARSDDEQRHPQVFRGLQKQKISEYSASNKKT